MKKYKINVTVEDIQNGEPGNCKKCAVALAVKRVFPNKEVEIKTHEKGDIDIWSDEGDVYIALDDKLYEFDFDLNKKLYTFIDRFDSEYGVNPFEFDLETR